ncbi:MAG TPA: HPr family phosphocarrier protein, partial [Tepidisphaeraceae bacterium]|nr:HPr family phosphocarrier protein [Tepidisphaeraceae bacterium]
MAERTLEVTSRLGLHARAAANLVRVASRFKSKLTLQRLEGGLEADAKSILSILTLAASYGTALKLVATGDDEQEALEALVGLFSRAFDENEKAEARPSVAVKHELRARGLGVSDGVVIGRVLRLQQGARDVYRAEIVEGDLERERRRFRAAVRLSRRQL